MATRLSVLFLTLLCLLTLSSCDYGSAALNPGDTAPHFALPNLQSQEIKLSDFKGQVILLNFWASWCGPCIAEMPGLQKLYEQFKERGLAVIAIGIDDELSKLSEFSDKFGLSFPILLDREGVTRRPYQISGLPESFLIDRNGKFILFSDLDDNSPVVKIIGPRDWTSPNAINRISKLLS